MFLFDNWPHPHGVVPAHLTLAAAAYYQPLFARAQQAAPHDSPAMFVLDRQRLAPYRDDATQFDNRWVARIPGRDALKTLGIHRLLYVAPTSRSPVELDDLNDDFVAASIAGISIVAVDVSALDASHPPTTAPGAAYSPVPRTTLFSHGTAAAPGSTRPTPPEFGSVPVVIAVIGGTMLGVRWSRSGTWNRGGGWGGG